MSNPREKWYESEGIKQQRKKSLWRILCAWKLHDRSFKFITSQKPFFLHVWRVIYTLENWRNHICDVDNIGQWINKARSHELHQYVRTNTVQVQKTIREALDSGHRENSTLFLETFQLPVSHFFLSPPK